MNKALLAIDFINDIAHPDGRIAASAAHVVEQDAIAHANQALAHARAHGWLVILIKVGFDGGYLLQPKGSPMFGRAQQLGALSLADSGTDFHPELDVAPGDLVLTKPRVSRPPRGTGTIGTTASPYWKMPAPPPMPMSTTPPCASSAASPRSSRWPS